MRTAPSPKRARHPSSGWIWLVVAAVVWLQAWLGGGREDWLQGYAPMAVGDDYYSQLVHGFRDGHTYLKVDVDPGLLGSDPAVVANAPTLLDAALFKGHFYLYYGVTPAIVALLPFSLLTGHDLPPNATTLLFVIAGFGFTVALLRHVTNDHQVPLGGPFAGLLVLLLGLATATPLLVSRSSFYEIPIAAGYACAMASIRWLYLAWRRGSAVDLARASLAAGLAVGGRPDHILWLPLVALAAWGMARRTGNSASDQRRLFSAALLPAAAVGLGLAAYNLARFGNPLDSGFNYGRHIQG